MISVDQVKLNFGGFELFKGISFFVNPKDRIGLVGKNGAGKSTLLKLLAGFLSANEGEIVKSKDTTIGYLPQNMLITDTRTVTEEATSAFDTILEMEKEIESLNHAIATRTDYESQSYHQLIDRVTELNDRFGMIGGNSFEAEIEQTLLGLGFKRSDFTRQTSEFSGGWRMRIELAKLILRKPDVFLLDEPTNHLDIESIQWLEDFLKTYNGAIMLVSHDKAFLDNVTNRTIEITLGKIYDYKTNYSKFIELRAERREQQLSAYRNQQKQIQDTEEFIERFRYKATKSVQVQSRIKQLDKIDRIEVDEEDARSLNIKFPAAPRSGKQIVVTKELGKAYGKLQVLENIDFAIEQGEKVAFVGKNGEGKTTLARIITGELDHTGEMKIGHNVKLGYFAQNQADLLDENLTVLETIDKVAVGDVRSKIRDILGAFMFSGEEVEKKVKVLSGGERTRLAMVRLMLEPYNFLVLDEPTNHLDIRSKEILKLALAAFEGTVLIVSHDREFLDGLVNMVYEFKDKKIKQHIGGIYDFLQKKKIESLRELEVKQQQQIETLKATPNEPAKTDELSYEQKKEIGRQISKAEKNIAKVEDEITAKENEIAAIDRLFSKPENLNDHSLFTKYDNLKTELEQIMEEWEKQTEELSLLQSKKTW